MNDVVSEARAALANLRAAREECCRAVTYSSLHTAASELETAALDAEEAIAAVLDRLDTLAPLAAAAERYRAAVAAEKEAKLRFDAEVRNEQGSRAALDKARERWVDATREARFAHAALAKVAGGER